MKQQDKKEKNGGFNMIKTLRKQLKNEKGLTLIELLAVIVILAIIAAIAIPAIGNIIKNSQLGALKSDNLNAIAGAELYALDIPQDDIEPETEVIFVEDGELTDDGKLYLEDVGGLDSFTFNLNNKTVTSVAEKGGIKLEAENATKAEFIDLPNNSKDGEYDNLTVTRD